MNSRITSVNSNPNSGNLKDMESKINSLERANFDLKMKLHYLNKKYVTANVTGGKGDGEGGGGGGDPSGMFMMGDTQIDILAMKEENDYSKRRILELESELLQLQLIRDREAHEFQKALKVKQPTADSISQEENRKREREVAKAIAEHDAALIKKLQEESSILQRQREQDKILVDNLTNDLAKTKLLLEEKEQEVEELRNKNKDLQMKIELLKEERDYEENGGMVIPHGSAPRIGRNGRNQGPPMLFSANTNGQQTSILINSNAFTAASSVAPPPQSPYPYRTAQAQQASNPSTFLLQTHPQQSQLPYQQQSSQPYAAQQPPYQNQQSFNQSIDGVMNASALNGDLPVVYQENQVLRDRLSKLQESISSQEKIINNMKTSAREFNLIESEEIKRLEGELDKILEDKEKLRQKCQKVEVELEISVQQLQQYRRYYGPLDIAAISSASPYQQQRNGGGFQVINRNILEIQQYERTIEQYRHREAELIAALEGVVKRCQELESQHARFTQSKLKLR